METAPTQQPVVAIESVQFSWPGQSPVIDIKSLAIGAGEKVFLAGPSGSGKSTLLGLIGGVLSPDEGDIRVLNQSLNDLSVAGRDRHRADFVGFVFQLFNLLPYLSVIDNVTLPCRFSQRRLQRALRKSDSLENEAIRLLDHLELTAEMMKRSVTELSIGQQQRVAVARALIGSPELLIADEPTSALDHDLRQRFIDLLLGECEAASSAVLFVSHDRSLGPLFDREVRLSEINRAGAGHE